MPLQTSDLPNKEMPHSSLECKYCISLDDASSAQIFLEHEFIEIEKWPSLKPHDNQPTTIETKQQHTPTMGKEENLDVLARNKDKSDEFTWNKPESDETTSDEDKPDKS